MTDAGIIMSWYKWISKGGEGESDHVRYSMPLEYVDTMLDYTGQWGFKYSDITATRKIQTVIKRLNTS
jgi:hypothetical protein